MRLSAFSVLCLTAGPVRADVSIQLVNEATGAPVANALVFAPSLRPTAQTETVIEQHDFEFQPRFSVTQVGSVVHFPNRDRSRHHVYSFSPAKQFELKLYHGEAAEPVPFDTPGIVTLGCNVHDWMVAWLYVVDSEVWQLSDDQGAATLDVADDAVLMVWHPFLRESVRLDAGERRVGNLTLRTDIVLPERPERSRQNRRSVRRGVR